MLEHFLRFTHKTILVCDLCWLSPWSELSLSLLSSLISCFSEARSSLWALFGSPPISSFGLRPLFLFTVWKAAQFCCSAERSSRGSALEVINVSEHVCLSVGAHASSVLTSLSAVTLGCILAVGCGSTLGCSLLFQLGYSSGQSRVQGAGPTSVLTASFHLFKWSGTANYCLISFH